MQSPFLSKGTMKKRKKRNKVIWIILLIFLLALLSAGCNDEEDENEDIPKWLNGATRIEQLQFEEWMLTH